jgi:hypothetical protein
MAVRRSWPSVTTRTSWFRPALVSTRASFCLLTWPGVLDGLAAAALPDSEAQEDLMLALAALVPNDVEVRSRVTFDVCS